MSQVEQSARFSSRLGAFLFEMALLLVCVAAAKPLFHRFQGTINRFFNIGMLDLRESDFFQIATTLAIVCGVILLVMTLVNRTLWWDNGRRFVNELYAVGLGLSLTTLYTFVGSTIVFAPAYFLGLYVLSFGSLLVAYAVLSLFRKSTEEKRPSFIGSLFRSLISPLHWVVVAVASVPFVLMVLYKVDDEWANAINVFRTNWVAGESADWVLRDRFPGHNFSQPIAIDQSVYKTNTYFVLERAGRIIKLHPEEEDEFARTTMLDITELVDMEVENGALGMALHPEFGLEHSDNRGFVYLYYTTVDGKDQLNRIARFNLLEETLEERLKSQFVLIEQRRNKNRFHNGGDVTFGPDGFLYVSLGDALDDDNHQVLDRGFFCGILRIDVDQLGGKRSQPIQTVSKLGKSQGYFIPKDNPFANEEGKLGEFYAWGFRNPWRMSFDQQTGKLWVGDNGESRWEEISVVSAGSNCQYPIFEGTEQKVKDYELIGEEMPPFYAYPHTALERSVIGGVIYRGPLHKELQGLYLYGDGFAGRLYALDAEDAGEGPKTLANTPYKGQSGLSSFFQTRRGDVLATVLGSKKKATGKVLHLVKDDGTGDGEEEAMIVDLDLSPREFFKAQCAICHGLQGKGDGPRAKDFKKKPKDLTSDEWQDKVTDDHIYNVISKGGAAVGLDNAMPGWHLYFTPEQTREMVAFVRGLRAQRDGAAENGE